MLEKSGNPMPIEIETQYIWYAVYTDDTVLPEYELADGGRLLRHFFDEIDLPRCKNFVLHSLSPDVKDVTLKINLEAGQRPIFFRRHPTEFDFQTQETTQLPPIHVIGWQQTVHNKNISSYMYIYPDGSILLSDNFSET